MGYQHMSPKDAVEAFTVLEAKLMIPYHYGSFKLADDAFDEAIIEFKNLISTKPLEKFEILKEGKGYQL